MIPVMDYDATNEFKFGSLTLYLSPFLSLSLLLSPLAIADCYPVGCVHYMFIIFSLALYRGAFLFCYCLVDGVGFGLACGIVRAAFLLKIANI